MKYKFGLTNDRSELEAAQSWRDAAVADGWTIEPTYPGHEVNVRASSHKFSQESI